MKLKKIIVMCMTCLFCTSICLSNIAALESKGAVCDPYSYYKPSQVSTKYVINKEGTFRNEGAQVQSKTVTYSTTYSSSISSGIKYEFDLVASKLGFEAKVSHGQSSTVTVSTTFNISPRHVGTYKVGQTKKETTGYIVNVLSNCTTTQKYVSAVYSVGEYDSYSEKAI